MATIDRELKLVFLNFGSWAEEELSELRQAIENDDLEAALDAIFDLFGLSVAVVIELHDVAPRAILRAFGLYRASQLSRGRRIDLPHHTVVQRVVLDLVNGDMAMIVRLIADRPYARIARIAPVVAAAKAAYRTVTERENH